MKVFVSDEYVNYKAKFFSSLLMLFVIMHHSVNLNGRIAGFSQSEGFNYYMQNFISAGIAIVDVPLFFMISGYYFFYKVKGFNFISYKDKVAKRFKTLVIPYLLVSLWALLLLFVLQHITPLKPFFKYGLIENYSPFDFIYSLFIHPLAYQLWFLRNLFCIILLTPIIFLIIKKIKLIFVVSITICWVLFTEKFSDGILTTITFFSIGAYFSLNEIKFPRLNNLLLTVISLIFWIILIVVVITFKTDDTSMIHVVDEISILVGIFALWCLYDFVKLTLKVNTGLTMKIATYSFFLYLFHEPILSMLIKLLFTILGKTILSSAIIYWFAPLITIFVCYVGVIILKKYTASLYSIITGSRQ